jgi:hypothetical protein
MLVLGLGLFLVLGWIELIKLGLHAKFGLKRTNGVRVMALQSFQKNGYVWANF